VDALMSCIAVVDDAPFNREFVRAVLERQGHTVVEAADGRDGYDLVRSVPVDLAVVDLSMPVCSGAELLHLIRSDATVASLPVVVLSALDDAGTGLKHLGAEAYLVKPVHAADLAAEVERILHRLPASATTASRPS
jgi:CheY-like chemotaxis protein